MPSDDRKRVKASSWSIFTDSLQRWNLLDCAEKYGIPVIEDAAQIMVQSAE